MFMEFKKMFAEFCKVVSYHSKKNSHNTSITFHMFKDMSMTFLNVHTFKNMCMTFLESVHET